MPKLKAITPLELEKLTDAAQEAQAAATAMSNRLRSASDVEELLRGAAREATDATPMGPLTAATIFLAVSRSFADLSMAFLMHAKLGEQRREIEAKLSARAAGMRKSLKEKT